MGDRRAVVERHRHRGVTAALWSVTRVQNDRATCDTLGVAVSDTVVVSMVSRWLCRLSRRRD